MDKALESTKVGEEKAKYDAPARSTWLRRPTKHIIAIVIFSIAAGWVISHLF